MSEPDWKTKKVLIVDNDAAFVSMAKTALSGVGVSDVRTVASVPEAVKLMAEYPADLVIIEISLPRVNGAQLAKVLRDKWRSPNPDVLIIVVVATSKADALRQACDAGVENFIRKPVSAENLIKRIGSILKRPKRFVSAGGYFGPDRRNPDVIAYSRPERRKAPETVASSQPPSEREARNFNLVEEPDHPPPLDNVSEDDVPLVDAPVPTPPTAEPTVAAPLTDAPMPAVKGTSKEEWSEAVALAEDTVELDTEEPDAALLSVLDEHVTWLRTKGKEGEKAAFAGANLSGVNLAGANLANANLREANLSE